MSESSSTPARCQQCGAPMSAAPEGLCPRCVMAQVMQPTQDGNAGAPLPPLTPAELAPHFPQLEILECLGRGGMGVVYKARQKSLNRLVALKLLAPERVQDPAFAGRFTHEAQALAALNHPNIVTVHEFGRADELYYLLMEFVDGVNLRQLLQSRRLTPKEALAIIPPICDALQFAHDHSIVHRDIKPENLLLDKNNRVKIADFGIAKMIGAAPAGSVAEAASSSPGPATLTVGTPDYAAPEQRAGNGSADHRADIYSLGVVLYEMLTGERPKDKLEPPSRRVEVDFRIDEIVLRALERTPEMRFATAADFRTHVEAVTSSTSSHAAPVIGKTRAADSRLSRLALWGALWILALPLGLSINSVASIRMANSGLPHDSALRHAVGFPALVLIALGQISMLGTTILGWVAIRQIRRSEGRLHGLALAVMDGLFYPILALDFVILSAVLYGARQSIHSAFPTQPPDFSGQTLQARLIAAGLVTALILFIVWIDYWIVRKVWRVLNPQPATPSAPPDSNTPLATAASTFAWASGGLAAITWMCMPQPPWLLACSILVAAILALLLAIPVQGTPRGRWAFWFGAVQIAVWFALWLIFAFAIPVPQNPRVGATSFGPPVERSGFPKAASITRNGGTVFVKHDGTEVHYVFFARKAIGSMDSSSHNTHSLTWIDKGSFNLNGKQTFGFLRESVDPLHLEVNGKEYDLRQGRVFLPHEDGTLEQRLLPISLTTAMDPNALARLITDAGATPDSPSLLPQSAVDAARNQLQTPRDRFDAGAANAVEKYKTAPVTKGAMNNCVTAEGTLAPNADDYISWHVNAMVAEADSAPVHAGQNVEFTVDAFPRRTFHGNVVQVSDEPKTVQNVICYPTKIRVTDSEPKFKPGMTANVAILVVERKGVLMIPNAALRFSVPGDAPARTGVAPPYRTVYLLGGGRPQPVPIKTGISDGIHTEILEGLKEGDQVVVDRMPAGPASSDSLPSVETARIPNPAPTPAAATRPSLLPQSAVDLARAQVAIAQERYNAGAASAVEMARAEEYLKWAEAMHAGDRLAAAQAKCDGARKRLELLQHSYQAGVVSSEELATGQRELGEAEAALLEAAPRVDGSPLP